MAVSAIDSQRSAGTGSDGCDSDVSAALSATALSKPHATDEGTQRDASDEGEVAQIVSRSREQRDQQGSTNNEDH